MKQRKELKLVECSGTAYDIGKQYGTACKESIVKSIEMNMGGLMFGYKANKEQVIANARKFLPLVKDFDPDLIAMLEGQAEGAGVSFDEVFSLRCFIELISHHNRIMSLCTSFAATGEATKDGKTIIGQNLDYFAGAPQDLLRIKYSNGLDQLVLLCGAGNEIILTSAGLGIVANGLWSPQEEQRLHVPCACAISKAMRQKTLVEALGVFCGAPSGVLHHMLASGEGDIISIETYPDDFNVLQPEEDILVHTNHYLTERFKKGEWVWKFSGASTYLRLQRIKRLMKKHYGRLSAEVMMEIMADHNGYPNSICKHQDENKPQELRGETTTSVIMIPEDRVMYVTLGQPCKFEYVAYRL